MGIIDPFKMPVFGDIPKQLVYSGNFDKLWMFIGYSTSSAINAISIRLKVLYNLCEDAVKTLTK